MPKNNNLEQVVLPMAIRFDEDPRTKFKNNLESIKLTLMQAPSMDDLRAYLPSFVTATWADVPSAKDNMPIQEKDAIIKDAFFGRTLPTALETINLIFRLEGISLQEVTHILRYRNASFSADCSGDKWWTNKDALVPNSIENSTGSGLQFPYRDDRIGSHAAISKDDFCARYKQVVNMAKELYCDMIDSKQISIMDARYILPRCLETFYYMRINLKDAIGFIKQRIDKQIQPETDNIIAYQMYCAILKLYPIANGLVDIHSPSSFYVNNARTGNATNLYFPDEDSDLFYWNENDFIYQKKRNEMNGTDPTAKNKFDELLANYECVIKLFESTNNVILADLYNTKVEVEEW